MNIKSQKGVALVIVLWMLVIFMLMGFNYSKTMRTEAKLTATLVYKAKTKAVAEAGIWIGVKELLNAKKKHNQLNNSSSTTQFNGIKLTTFIQNENGKIDINKASEELLSTILKKSIPSEDIQIKVLHSILDWRDKDNQARTYGSETKDYVSAGFDYSAKNGPFNHTSELQKVMGFDPKIYKILKPTITVHSHKTGIDLYAAPKEVLLLLPSINSENIDELIESRKHGNVDEIVYQYDINEKYLIKNRGGRIYTIYSIAEYNKYKIRLDVVVLLNQNRKNPYTILSWNWNNN